MAGAVARAVGRLGLRFPALFAILLTLTLADLIVPDVLPFVDEIVLAVLTAMVGLWRERRGTPDRTRPAATPARDSDPTHSA